MQQIWYYLAYKNSKILKYGVFFVSKHFSPYAPAGNHTQGPTMVTLDLTLNRWCLYSQKSCVDTIPNIQKNLHFNYNIKINAFSHVQLIFYYISTHIHKSPEIMYLSSYIQLIHPVLYYVIQNCLPYNT